MARSRRLARALTLGAALVLAPATALASACHSFVESVPGTRVARLAPEAPTAIPGLAPAPWRLGQSGAQNVAQNGSEGPAPDPSAVLIEYVTHSTYRITTPGDVVVATDYFGTHGRGRLPDIVTMNHAHETHFTSFPDPDIAHVLRGWNPFGDGPAAHLLELRDIVVRNVPTDIRSGISGRETDGNSIFVFEVGELCIGHLGHLHHLLSENHYAQLGRIDVVMAPVDGTFTLNVEDMISILKRLRSRVVLPMHAFGSYSMRLFLDGMSDAFRIAHSDQRVLRISATTLPEDPTVIVLANHFWRGGDD